MNHRVACLMLAGLAVAASVAVSSSSTAPHPGADVEILVDGVPQRRYAHDGRWYVEALKGREYSIRLRNPYPVRVAVALSVDGLNTIDARHTTAAGARKWVLDPYQTVTIAGWQTSRTEARHFEFTTEGRSYAQALGQTANLGVITAAFFKERVRVIIPDTVTSDTGRQAPAAPSASAAAESHGDVAARAGAKEEYAATGMGRRTGHAVTHVWLDLEESPAQTVNIRYEFRPQLVRLGILPSAPTADPLDRRERAHGFDTGFCPEPPRKR